MNSQEIVEDEIDTETLQAQIDLSMSFAQNLVSSWMEPHKFPTSSRKKNLEQELAEYMKRPPRLGVGAVTPEGVQSMARETARLKGKLSGSKRSREEGVPSKSASDDEGESRGGAIKKKARPDPFNVVHGKKKGKASDKTVVQPVIPVPTVDQSKLDSSDEIEDILNAPDHLDESPVKKKAKTAVHVDKGTPFDTSDVSDLQRGATSLSSSKKNAVAADTPSAPSRTSKIEATIDVSITKTPALRKTLSAELLKVPLLNLTRPSSDHESDGEPATGTPSSSPKKKRRRRKKKKNHGIPDSTGACNSTAQTIPT